MEDRPLPLLPFLLQLLSGKSRNLTMTQIIKKGKCQKFFFLSKMIVTSYPEVSWERGLSCGRFEAFILSQYLNICISQVHFQIC